MFLCRSSKTLGKALITHGSSSLQVPAANRLRNVTLTLHKVHTPQTKRAFCLTSFQGQVIIANHTKRPEKDLNLRQSWDSCGFTADWQHLDRVATIATCLSKSVQSQGGRGDILTPQIGSVYRLYVTINGAAGNVCFSGNSGFFNRSCFSTGTMQTRASSTAAATKQREASEEQSVSSNKGDEQNLKDALSTNPSSSGEKAAGKSEPEPEGGKPNKTEQLKKVFKEYGAVGVSFHVCISLMSLGMSYLLVSSGIDMAAVLCKVGFSEAMVKSKMAAGTSTFVLAYAIHKLFAPVRISITLVSVPLIVRYFRKTGLFKQPPPAQ